MNSELCFMSATRLAEEIRQRRVSPVEVVDAVLSRIDRINPIINCYCTVAAEQASKDARIAEQAVMRGDIVGPLHGIPVSVKDVTNTKGVRTTRGSRLFADNVPLEDAPAVARLKAAGAIVVGKTNTPELGWKAVTDNALFGATRNPWDLSRTPGGSSGGAGAAVAGGMGPIATGTDGGGSIRIPASFTGTVGLKPTFGLVPHFPPGTQDTMAHTGPIARTVSDAALMLDVMSGPDLRDRHSLPQMPPTSVDVMKGVKGLRVAWSGDFGHAVVDPEVLELVESAARRFAELGCVVEEATPPYGDVEEDLSATRFTYTRAVLSGLRPDWQAMIDPSLLRAIESAPEISAVQLVQVNIRRNRLVDRVAQFFTRFDLLLSPVAGCAPFGLGVDGPETIAGKPVPPSGWHPFCAPMNLTGQPAISVPCGQTEGGLPVGLQIAGRRFEDGLVLRAAAAWEALEPWAERRPALLASA